jgi:phage/plasmid-associated DNA primase
MGTDVTVTNDANLTVFEISSDVAVVTNLLDAGDGGAVELALQTALASVTNAGSKEAVAILYGAGATGGDAAAYSVSLANGADAVTGNMTVDLLAYFDDGVEADSFIPYNIIAS